MRVKALTLLVLLLMWGSAAWPDSFGAGNLVKPGSGGGASYVGTPPIVVVGSAISAPGIPTGVINVQTNEGAKCNGVMNYDGAMTSTSSTLSSSAATFTTVDVGKLVCVEKISSGNGERCGTISTFVDAHDVTLSVSNASGSSLTGLQYAYGTNDTTALTNALAIGGIVWFPPGICTVNAQLTLPTNVSLTIQGSGSAMFTYYDDDDTLYVTGGNPTSALLWLTTSMPSNSAGLYSNLGSSSETAIDQAYMQKIVIEDITIQAGVGRKYDGGGSTIDGIYLSSLGRSLLENVVVYNWGQDGILMGPWSGGTLINSFSQANGRDGVTLTGSTSVQTLLLTNDLSNNQRYGLYLGGGSGANPVVLGNILQWNAGLSADGAEIGGSTNGAVIEGNAIDGGIDYTSNWANGIIFQGNTWSNPEIIGFSVAGVPLPTVSKFNAHQPPVCATDATGCTAGTIYTGSASTACLVQSNGTNWIETGVGCY